MQHRCQPRDGSSTASYCSFPETRAACRSCTPRNEDPSQTWPYSPYPPYRCLCRLRDQTYIAASASACVPVPVSVSSKVIWSFGKALSYVPQWPTFHLTSSVRPQQYQYHSAFERAISYCAAFTSPCELISLIIEQSAGAAVRAGHQGIVSAPIVREGTRSPLFQPTGLLVSRSFICTERLV